MTFLIKFSVYAFLCVCLISNAQIYKWKDKSGRIHYSQTKPKHIQEAKDVDITDNKIDSGNEDQTSQSDEAVQNEVTDDEEDLFGEKLYNTILGKWSCSTVDGYKGNIVLNFEKGGRLWGTVNLRKKGQKISGTHSGEWNSLGKFLGVEMHFSYTENGEKKTKRAREGFEVIKITDNYIITKDRKGEIDRLVRMR